MRRKPLGILFGVLAVAAVAARYFWYFHATNAPTGFTANSMQALGVGLSIAFVAVLAACVISFRLTKDPAAQGLRRSIPLGVVCFPLAASLCFDTVVSFGGELLPIDYAVGILALLSALYFAWFGMDRLLGRNSCPALLSLAPLVLSALKLVVFYTDFHNVTAITEGIVELFSLCLGTLFWLYHTKMVLGQNTRRSAQWGYGFGIPAAACYLMITLPRLVAPLTYRAEFTAHGSRVEWASIVAALYIAVFLVEYHRASVRPSEAEELLSDSEEAELPCEE